MLIKAIIIIIGENQNSKEVQIAILINIAVPNLREAFEDALAS